MQLMAMHLATSSKHRYLPAWAMVVRVTYALRITRGICIYLVKTLVFIRPSLPKTRQPPHGRKAGAPDSSTRLRLHWMRAGPGLSLTCDVRSPNHSEGICN